MIMSTVTTRLCQYCHTHPCKHTPAPQVILKPATSRTQKAKEVHHANAMRRWADIIARIENLAADGVEPARIVTELGIDKTALRRRLEWAERYDLAALFPPRRNRRCALAGCRHYAGWDVDLRTWTYLCREHQEIENICEDLEFLRSWRGGEVWEPYELASRVGYPATLEGLEALRQRLKRWGRLDLRDALNTEITEPPRQWATKGTVRLSAGGSGHLQRWASTATAAYQPV
jgi:hypothetical protein